MTKRNTRIEDGRLVTGRGSFAADRVLPGELHAYFVRAERAHADLLAVDTAGARGMPDVLAVLTAEDTLQAGFRSLPCSLPFTGVGDRALSRPERLVLARGRVRYVGEPIACVIARSPTAAADAGALIDVQYRDLPCVVDARLAIQERAPRIHDGIARNVCFEYEIGDRAAVGRAFGCAERHVRLPLTHQRLIGNPMEPRACVVSFDPEHGWYTIYTNTQGVNAIRGQLAEVVGCSPDAIRVIARDVGGGFGLRYNAYPEHSVLMLAARRFGQPVKWVATRGESFVSDEHGRAVQSVSEVALGAGGEFLAFRFHFLCDMGAYLTATGPFIDIGNVLETLTGIYRVPAVHARFDLVLTNTVPVGAYRGAGRPLAAYAVERVVDQAAADMGVDRIEIRRRNLVPRAAFPYRTPHAGTIDCGDFEGVLERAYAASGWSRFAARREISQSKGLLRGIGLACYIEYSSPGYFPRDEVEIRFCADGYVDLYAVTQSSGQGHETSFAHIVSDVLGIPAHRIRLRSGDPDVPLMGSATGGSRSLFGVGSVFKLAAEAVLRKSIGLAAAYFGVAVEDIEFADGVFRARSKRRELSLAALVARHATLAPHPLDTKTAAKFGGNYPNGCHVAEVEVDPSTGEVRLVQYTAVDDCGTVINPVVVEGQVIGGVMQGLGQALMEGARYDQESGQLLSGNFTDYAMPRAHHLPNIAVLEHPVPTSENPLGAKGVGEAGATGAPCAVMNALLDALRGAGVNEFDAPALPHRVWAALQAARNASKH
jgi:carbon-monoxide dehydrogenase large subunit